MWATILKLLTSIAAYLSNKQLLDAGEARGQAKQAEADDVARKKTKENNAAIDALSDDAIVVRMRKWKRKDL